MNNWHFLKFLVLGLFLITSCDDDKTAEENAAYEVDIEIISPVNNATIAKGETFTVEVDYARKGNTIHNILVEIINTNDNAVQKLVERHAHVANEFTFIKNGLTINKAGTYAIRALTTDLHDGMESPEGEHHGEGGDADAKNVVEHTITVQ